jgi:hypothetical protein
VSQVPDIDEVYIRKVFDSLGNMQVELDGDPLVFGPKRLNAKVAQCREYLSKCQQIYLQLADHLHQLSRASRQAKLDFDIKSQDLLANDPEVKSQRAIRDREAVVSSKLRAERETNHIIETAITDLQSVIMVVKAKREDLKDIQGRIRDQVKLCQEEISLGSRWGSAPPPGVRVNLDDHPRVDTAALAHYNKILGGLDGEACIEDLVQFADDNLAQEEAGQVPPAEDAEEVDEDAPASVELDSIVEDAPAPVVEPEPAPVVEEDRSLPIVEETDGPVQMTSASLAEVEDFFDSLDDTPAATKPAPATPTALPPIAELDIDDLIGELGS